MPPPEHPQIRYWGARDGHILIEFCRFTRAKRFDWLPGEEALSGTVFLYTRRSWSKEVLGQHLTKTSTAEGLRRHSPPWFTEAEVLEAATGP